jgi:hypothetical protein
LFEVEYVGVLEGAVKQYEVLGTQSLATKHASGYAER